MQQIPLPPNARITYVLSSRSNAYGLTRASSHAPPIPHSACALKTFLSHNPGSTRLEYDTEIGRRVIASKPDLVVLAGWMLILSDAFLDILNGNKQPPSEPALPPPNSPSLLTTPASSIHTASPHSALRDAHRDTDTSLEPFHQTFPIPCINLHPALPGEFDGADAIGRAYQAFGRGEIRRTGVMVHRVVREVDRGEPLVVREMEMRDGDSLQDLEARIHEVG